MVTMELLPSDFGVARFWQFESLRGVFAMFLDDSTFGSFTHLCPQVGVSVNPIHHEN